MNKGGSDSDCSSASSVSNCSNEDKKAAKKAMKKAAKKEAKKAAKKAYNDEM